MLRWNEAGVVDMSETELEVREDWWSGVHSI